MNIIISDNYIGPNRKITEKAIKALGIAWGKGNGYGLIDGRSSSNYNNYGTTASDGTGDQWGFGSGWGVSNKNL